MVLSSKSVLGSLSFGRRQYGFEESIPDVISAKGELP